MNLGKHKTSPLFGSDVKLRVPVSYDDDNDDKSFYHKKTLPSKM
jgi:hypothetical protein